MAKRNYDRHIIDEQSIIMEIGMEKTFCILYCFLKLIVAVASLTSKDVGTCGIFISSQSGADLPFQRFHVRDLQASLNVNVACNGTFLILFSWVHKLEITHEIALL